MVARDDLVKQVTYDPESGLFTRVLSKGGQKAGNVVGKTDERGYVWFMLNYKRVSAHRMAFLFMTGRLLKMVDHIDRDKSNNRWGNLREVTPAQNQHNLVPRSSTGVLGVYKDSRCLNPYFASIQVDGKTFSSGYFNTVEEATVARKSMENFHR